MRALVIDDSRAMRLVVGRHLKKLGFEVLEAGDGVAALAALEGSADHLPMLATIDWNMPVMDGLTFVQVVRQRRDWRDITLMMVTTECEQAQMVRALAAGAHEYLIKPFAADAFAEKLDLLGLIPAGSIA